MPRVVKVNRAQVRAARMIIDRYERGIGPKPSAAVRAIAAAKRPERPAEEVVYELAD